MLFNIGFSADEEVVIKSYYALAKKDKDRLEEILEGVQKLTTDVIMLQILSSCIIKLRRLSKEEFERQYKAISSIDYSELYDEDISITNCAN